ncbi:hypothetical protein niasHT_009866 [Heterodera trifolii]|uniref:Uncharacterized protein n=1 Tax=Heterodera trifolii TaxID=157864 RepID=A0ABD2MD09_9BILA
MNKATNDVIAEHETNTGRERISRQQQRMEQQKTLATNSRRMGQQINVNLRKFSSLNDMHYDVHNGEVTQIGNTNVHKREENQNGNINLAQPNDDVALSNNDVGHTESQKTNVHNVEQTKNENTNVVQPNDDVALSNNDVGHTESQKTNVHNVEQTKNENTNVVQPKDDVGKNTERQNTNDDNVEKTLKENTTNVEQQTFDVGQNIEGEQIKEMLEERAKEKKQAYDENGEPKSKRSIMKDTEQKEAGKS